MDYCPLFPGVRRHFGIVATRGDGMNIKRFFTLASAMNLFYGVWFFFFPENVAIIYGFGELATPLSNVFMQFLGIYSVAAAVLFWICRRAEVSPGRTAALAFLAVSALLCLYMDIKTLMGAPGVMDYVDTLLNGVFGFAALYFILQDRNVEEVRG